MENKETKFRFYLNRQGVIGRQGIKGDKGFSPEISVEKDTLSEYILRITNESSYFLTTNLREHKEDRGGTYIRLDRTTGAMYAGEADRATTDTAGVVKMATPDEMMNADENSVVTPANLTDFVTDILVDYVTIAALDNKLLDYAKKVDVQAELAQCVKVTGNQNIAGKKVFSDRVYFNNGISSGKDIYGSNVITPKVTARDSLNGYTPDLINQDGFTLKVGVANNPNAPVNIQNGLRVNYFESEGKPVETVRNGQIYENIDSGNINNFISVDPATVDKAGIVKPDGTSITVDPDGTIHAESGTPSENTMTLDTDQEVNSSKTFLKDQAMKSNTLDVTTARNERGNAFIFSDKNGTQIAGVSSYVNNNGSPECRFIASNGTQSAFAGLGVTKDGQGFFEIPEPAEDSNNNDAVPSSWVNKKLDTKQPKGNYVKTVNNTTPDASGNVNVSGGGDVTKKYVDEQDAKKQDKLTSVSPLLIQNNVEHSNLDNLTFVESVGYGNANTTNEDILASSLQANSKYSPTTFDAESKRTGRIVLPLQENVFYMYPLTTSQYKTANRAVLGYIDTKNKFIPVMSPWGSDGSWYLRLNKFENDILDSSSHLLSVPYTQNNLSRDHMPTSCFTLSVNKSAAQLTITRHGPAWTDSIRCDLKQPVDKDLLKKCTHICFLTASGNARVGTYTTSYSSTQNYMPSGDNINFGMFAIDKTYAEKLEDSNFNGNNYVRTQPNLALEHLAYFTNDISLNLGQGLSVNADGKLEASLGMPSDKFDDLVLGASGTKGVAPADGWIVFEKKITASNQFIALGVLKNPSGGTDAANRLLYVSEFHSSSGAASSVIMPVRKGQTYFVLYSAAGDKVIFQFVYAEGSN